MFQAQYSGHDLLGRVFWGIQYKVKMLENVIL